jgi:hypothetical protein
MEFSGPLVWITGAWKQSTWTINAETGQVKMGPNHFSGNPTNQDLTSKMRLNCGPVSE